MLKLAILNIKGEESGSFELPENIFGSRINTDVLHQAVVMYQACLRQGNASTKERACVSGGGKKPYRQKGTGRARAGSSRSPLWKGGGVTFGPHPRDFDYSIPKKIKKSALRESLNVKYQDKNFVCINDLKDPVNKTKEFASILKNIGMKGKTLAILDGSDTSINRSSQNIVAFNLKRSVDVNAYDVMKYKNLLVTETALHQLLDRVKL